MFEGSADVSTKKNLYWFNEGQTHLGRPGGAKKSLALNEPK